MSEMRDFADDGQPKSKPKSARVPMACIGTLVAGGAVAVLVAVMWATFPEDYALKKHYITDKDALCNDGSQGVYYIRQNPEITKWVLFFEPGGSICWDEASCTGHLDHMGSDSLPEIREWDGFLSEDEDKNPLYADYNVATIAYCSSDYYSGTSYNAAGNNYHYLGSIIAQGAVRDILATSTLALASEIIIAGQGAGGFGVLLNTEAILDLFDGAGVDADVRAVVDGAWWVFVEPLPQAQSCPTPSMCSLKDCINHGWNVWRPRLPARCVEAELTYECFYGHISNIGKFPIPIMVIDWVYEQAQYVSNGMYALPGMSFSQSQADFVENYKNEKFESFKLLPFGSAYYFPSCWDHEILTKSAWFNTYIAGIRLDEYLANWDSKKALTELPDICHGLDCNPSCRLYDPSKWEHDDADDSSDI
jgi:hypothetical protein